MTFEMRPFCIILAMLVLFPFVGGAQMFSNYDPQDEMFNYAVKVPEEFIERFNDDSGSFIRKVYAEEKKAYTLSRGRLLITLFNLDNLDFTKDTTYLADFFQQVLNKEHPVKLAFLDSNWYAEARCIFVIDKKQWEIPLYLHIKTQKGEWAKWMICGVGDAVPSKSAPADIVPGKQGTDTFISTSSHSTGFLAFHDVFRANIIPQYYFDQSILTNKNAESLVAGTRNGKVRFQYVRKMTYHFYQVPGWYFTADYFDRKTKNSGWLISNAIKVPEEEKKRNIDHLLGL